MSKADRKFDRKGKLRPAGGKGQPAPGFNNRNLFERDKHFKISPKHPGGGRS